MLGVLMCYIMLQLVLHDGIKRAREENEEAEEGRVLPFPSSEKMPGHRAG